MLESAKRPILRKIAPLLYEEDKAALNVGVLATPKKILDDIHDRGGRGESSQLFNMGANASGKTRRSGEEIAHFIFYGVPYIGYLAIERAQGWSRDYFGVDNPPGRQTPDDYTTSSAVLMYLSAEALKKEKGVVLVKEAQGFERRGEQDNIWAAGHQFGYEGIDVKNYWWLSTGNKQVFEKAAEDRKGTQAKIGFDSNAVLDGGRGGVWFSMEKYYEDEASYFREIAKEVSAKIRDGDAVYDPKFSYEYVASFWNRGINIFTDDFDYRADFMAQCLPEFYFQQELGLTPEQIATQVCITKMPFVKNSNDYRHLLDKYDIIAKLRETEVFQPMPLPLYC